MSGGGRGGVEHGKVLWEVALAPDCARHAGESWRDEACSFLCFCWQLVLEGLLLVFVHFSVPPMTAPLFQLRGMRTGRAARRWLILARWSGGDGEMAFVLYVTGDLAWEFEEECVL